MTNELTNELSLDQQHFLELLKDTVSIETAGITAGEYLTVEWDEDVWLNKEHDIMIGVEKNGDIYVIDNLSESHRVDSHGDLGRVMREVLDISIPAEEFWQANTLAGVAGAASGILDEELDIWVPTDWHKQQIKMATHDGDLEIALSSEQDGYGCVYSDWVWRLVVEDHVNGYYVAWIEWSDECESFLGKGGSEEIKVVSLDSIRWLVREMADDIRVLSEQACEQLLSWEESEKA